MSQHHYYMKLAVGKPIQKLQQSYFSSLFNVIDIRENVLIIDHNPTKIVR